MEFIAKVIDVLPEESGVSTSSGNAWKKKGWVVETPDERFPKKIKLDAFNAAADSLNIVGGKSYKFSVDLQSREYNGRWYTDVRVFRAEEVADSGYPGQTQQLQTPANPFASEPAPSPFSQADPFAAQPGAPGADAFGNENDDLPF